MSALDEHIENLMSFDDFEVESDALASPLNRSQNLVNFKAALLRKIFSNENEKVGIIGANSRIGQAAQGATSIAIPGDTSEIRSPVRSRVYSALTPGGGSGRGSRLRGLVQRAKPNGGPLRCPVGFEYGGRFASKNFRNCGRQLFDLPGGLGTGIGKGRGIGLLGLLKGEGELIKFGKFEGTPVQIERAAQIARVGAANDSKRVSAVKVGISALSDPSVSGGLLVRKDGSTLRTRVSNDVLGTIRENPDMEGASLLSAAKTPADIGDNGVSSIWIGNVKSVSYAIPGGGSISVERNGTLTNGQKRILTKAWAASAGKDFGQNNYGARLRDIVDKSNGTLSYDEKFPNIDNPSDLVDIVQVGNDKNKMTVPRWAFSAFLSEEAPGRGSNKPYAEVGKAAIKESSGGTDISSVADAVKHLSENGNPEEISPSLLGRALRRSDAFEVRKIRSNVDVLERGDGKSWYRTSPSGDYAHLSERVSSDLHSVLGLEGQKVSFIGEGSKRDYLLANPQNGSERKIQNLPISEISSEDLLRLSASDWLLDQRDRNPSNFRSIAKNDENRLIVGGNDLSALSGLSAEELKSRRNMILEDYLKENRNEQISGKFKELSDSQRKQMLRVYNDIVARATKFNWDDYLSKLNIDGQLSEAEKNHLELVKAVFEKRLETLRKSRAVYLQTIGLA